MPETLWRCIADPHHRLTEPVSEALRAEAARFAAMTSPATAAWLLGGAAPDGAPLVAPEDAERSRASHGAHRAVAGRWLAVIDRAGIETVVLKGFAIGALFYPDPALRGFADLDILVRSRDLDRLIELLAGHGFAFHYAADTPAWGHIGDASFHPFVASDGSMVFDLHIHPDDFPVHRGITTEMVFAEARTVTDAGVSIRAPSTDHLVLLAITNAMRDKFDPLAVRSLTDLVVMLARARVEPDWPHLLRIAKQGGFRRGMRAAVLLLHDLGVTAERLPADLLKGYEGFTERLAAREFARMRTEVEHMFPTRPSRLALQTREWFLSVGIDALALCNARRAIGLLRPWPGLPPDRSGK
jgi:hypothetical protein